MKRGVAPIKAEYLIAAVKQDVEKTAVAAENKSEDSEAQPVVAEGDKLSEAAAGEKHKIEEVTDKPVSRDENPKKKRRKGQNKQREKFSNQRATPENRLCKAILCETVCSYGEKCKFSHDVDDFLSKKPADLPGTCYNFSTRGRCPFSFACRFALCHVKKEDGKYINVVDKEKVSNSKSTNSLSKDDFFLLRKHKYDFSKAVEATKEAHKYVDKIAKRNIELNCMKKGQSLTSVCNKSLPEQTAKEGGDDVKAEPLPIAAEEPLPIAAEEPLPAAVEPLPEGTETNPSNTAVETKPLSDGPSIGPVTDEDEFTIKPGEKKTIDFKNKLYLAPLTTVGNLPFRRVCKSYGADVTCGEMALATKLLQGVTSEWALIKRHSSEDLFGVQLCGAFADSMSKCTQLLNQTCDIDFIDINVGCPIDLIFDQGAGSALMRRMNRFHEIVRSMVSVSTIPITAKIRTGISENKNTAHTVLPKLRDWGVAITTLHGRSREQRYTKVADWSYINDCAEVASPMPLFGGGDILSFEDYNSAMKTDVSGTMIARGALIKPWLFTEIKEQRHWDISSSERLEILRDFANYGLEHWGSDHQGIETTRRFMLEWLSFLHRYIPVGVLERVPQKINERPSPYIGRDDLETLMASTNSADWVKISEMLLGPTPPGFFFLAKHKANSYD